MLPGGTRPCLSASTIHCAALYPGEPGVANWGLPCPSRIVPPNAAVVWYQYVDSPSAAANGMFSGYWTSPFALICLRSCVYWSIVVGILVTPALVIFFLFSVVTWMDVSNGMPTTWPLMVYDTSWGMSAVNNNKTT